MAVLSGVFAQVLADRIPTFILQVSGIPVISLGGYTAPFDAALCFCVIGALLLRSWDDDLAKTKSPRSSFASSNEATISNPAKPRVLLCGLVVFGIECTMYIFIFHWTDALKEEDCHFTYHGYVFASFMMCCMIGSSIFSLASCSAERLLLVTVAVIILAWMGVVGARHFVAEWRTAMTFAAFLLFEAGLGIYFPAMSTVKSIVVPEGARSFVYSAYRAPMNLVVAIVLSLDLPFAPASIGSAALAVLAGSAAAALSCFHLAPSDSRVVSSSLMIPRPSESGSILFDGSQVHLEISPSFHK